MAAASNSSTETFRQPGGGERRERPLGFTPGTVLLGRYRIIKVLGRGGMAEVYQADDLKLGEPVALKFLSSAPSPLALNRLYNEVRNGRRVAHPNVCRIYDVVEDGPRHFIAMEYVDGDDLESLLQRVGRLPYENALRVSRDLCAGVAAAHDAGLLHRDLKPANVIIDGRGSPKITDFGIAAFHDEKARNELSGTLSYMAPEQLAGDGVSFQSDFYSLGLVMYEVFTGRRVFDADTLPQLLDAHRAPKRSPSELVHDIDSNVERVILKCLDEDVKQRPTSVREILAMLPGRDAIDAAVAAGETPPPEVVAAAQVESTLAPRIVGGLVAAAVIGMAGVIGLSRSTMFYARVPLEKSPEALAEDAQRIGVAIGLPLEGLRRHSWFERDDGAVRAASSWRQLESMTPGALHYVSYWTPRTMVPQDATGRLELDSPVELRHLNSITVDSSGRLVDFRFGDDAVGSHARAGELLALAGNPLPQSVRVGITTRNGLVDAFRVSHGPQPPPRRSPFAALLGLAPSWGSTPLVLVLASAAVLAIGPMLRNVRQGRADRVGAIKVASYVGAVSVIAWTCAADHGRTFEDEWLMVARGAGSSLFIAAMVWLFYSALEPSLRKRAPHVLIGWNRLLLGRFRDPLVGRDVLTAIIVGIVWNVFWRAMNLAPGLFGFPTLPPYGNLFEGFGSLRGAAFRLFALQGAAILFAFGIAFVFTTCLAVLRSKRAAFLATGVVMVPAAYQSLVQGHSSDLPFAVFFAIVMTASWLWFAWRFGVLALAVAIYVHFELCSFPLTIDSDSWFFGRSTLAIVILFSAIAWAALAAWRPRTVAA